MHYLQQRVLHFCNLRKAAWRATHTNHCFYYRIATSIRRHAFCVVKSVATAAITMKIAIPVCRQRIAPLFESAETFLLIDRERPANEASLWQMTNQQDDDRCRQLFDKGVTVLLCGAISCRWQSLLGEHGIEVHSFLAGDVPDVLNTYLEEGAAGLNRYAMPGRRGPGSRARRRVCRRGFFTHHRFVYEE